jgi:sulfoxide reductase heme-binding subunit YedZ
MGKRWQSLHNWIYLAAILAPIHFYWSVKSEIIEPSIYIALFAVLLFYRKDSIYKWLKPKK